ncbi:MAG: sulfotransferase [Deltaproteobacteria bacterium]
MLTMQQRLAGLPPALVPQIADLAQSIDRGRLAEADRALVVAAAQAPAHPEVLRLRGMLRLAQGHAIEAIALLSDASERRPDDASIHYTLALACEAAHDPVRALAAIRRACSTGPELADCWYGLGRMLFDAGQIQPGIDALQRAVELAPRHANARAMLATILNLDGRPDAAQAQYREIVAQRPGSGAAWWGLATLRPMPLDADDIVRMSAALQTSGLAETDRIALLFALAHAQEVQGEYAPALASLRQAHALARRRDPWDARQFDARIDAILDAFSKPREGARSGRGKEVIFIASLPRSGSTLTEQILASHSQVQGTSELADLPLLIKAESARQQQLFPQWTEALTDAQWDDLGQRYLARTARWREQKPRFTDKMPGNWLYVGAILTMLPQARVVICRRDPLETCFGCYRYHFNQHGYTHDFNDLAAAWRGFDRATRHWQALYPDRVYVQEYEMLAADPDARIRALLDFCGLPFEENCLNFHATERRVATPSAAQVREPIRRDTARADKYGALLDPLRAALGLPAFAAPSRG